MQIEDETLVTFADIALGDPFLYVTASDEILCLKVDTVEGVPNAIRFDNAQKLQLLLTGSCRTAEAHVVRTG